MIVYFVGGVHGAGKSTLCSALSARLGADHVIASQLIEHMPSRSDPTGKAVTSLHSNQDRLISAISKRQSAADSLLLDGHFALIGREDQILRIPLRTFLQIDPIALLLVEAEPDVLNQRLKERDGRQVGIDLLVRLSAEERSHAKFVSAALSKPFMSWNAELKAGDALQFFLSASKR